MIIRTAFTTPIFQFDIFNKELNDELREDAYLQQKNNNGREVSNAGGFQSNHIYDSEPALRFLNTAEDCISKVKGAIKYDKELTLHGLWYNINKKNNLNKMHCHGRSFLAATYYIDAPENCGTIAFENIDRHVVMEGQSKNYDNPYFNGFYNFVPKQGTLLIFYAWLNHQVNPNKSDRDRVSLAFNIE